MILIFFTFCCLFLRVHGDYASAAYECPTGWDDFEESCYRFVRDPVLERELAKVDCARDGAYLLSVNHDREHLFVVDRLQVYDSGQIKQNWWTSGRRKTGVNESMEFYWEGDGNKIESYFYWFNSSIPADMTKDFILYHNDGYEWGWIVGMGIVMSPYVCEISKEDIYKIQQQDRGPDYGVNNPDAETIPRGPKFTLQPVDTIYERYSPEQFVTLECIADAYPPADYAWYKTRQGVEVKIDPVENPRYTLVGGQLIIHSPTDLEQDDGLYQCHATNTFGTIHSNIARLSFGYLQDFPKSPRSPVEATEYQWASIECNPPPHYPEVLHSWYKDSIFNFIRPELKPYIMISHDGRLYFSEVTMDDVGEYFCMVTKPGLGTTMGKVSEPTELRVRQGSPGTYEPQIGSGFPLVYPYAPKIGDTVRLECWASGTAAPSEKLDYNWDKVVMVNGQPQSRPLPNQARMIDHNRVVIIPDIQLYDAGTYRCFARRQYGLVKNKTVEVLLSSVPYFILNLKDQFADINTPLKWRCEAGGSPPPDYFWLKNGQILDNSTIPEDDKDRVFVYNNVLEFTYLDPDKDDGMYQCTARNLHGTRHSTAELRVISFAPSFAKYPMSAKQFATEHGNTTLLCRPEAAPYPTYENIIWRKDGVILSPGEEGSGARLIKLTNGNLFVSPVESGDSGVYQCYVENELGFAATEGNLTVLDTTTIGRGPYDATIQMNRTDFLHCVASYNPQLDVTYVWFHGDYLIEFEKVFRLGENRYEVWYHPHFKRGSGIYNGGLYIMRAQYEHAGRYTCVIESASGSLETDAQVRISGPPSEPAGVYLDSATVTTTSVRVRWKASGDNLSPIKSYVVEGINQWEGFWKVLETNVRVVPDERDSLVHVVTGLRPYSEYQIRLRAENALGTSSASLPSEAFTTRPTRPDLAPQRVGGGGGRVGDLVITWQHLDPWEQNGPNFRYTVYWKNAGDDEWDGIREVPGSTNRYVVLVGENHFYREYDVAVRAVNDEGEGPLSSLVTIRSAMALPPATAQDVRVQPWNATACLVHWDPVDDTRDSVKGKLGGYRISYWKECCETEEMAPRLTINGQAEEGLVIGLYPNTPYYFDVMVWNQAGNGPKSQFFIQRTLRNAPINPPVEVSVERRSDSAIHVNWRGVSTNQAEEPLEGYKVRIWREGEHIKVAEDYDARKETDLYIDGLDSKETYKLRVFGYSRGGDGTMSSPAIIFHLGAASHLQMSVLLMTFCSIFATLTRH